MSINKYLPHIFVLPEDDANRQLARGFLLDQSVSASSIQVLPEVKGWNKVVDCFLSDHVPEMQRYPRRSMVLLIDFDGQLDRLTIVKAKIPAQVADRVYILGALNEPEDFKIGSFEAVGLSLAKDCREGTEITWSHAELKHNGSELARLRKGVRPILFPSIG